MKIIGLTGGIASGKSLVESWFVDASVLLIEADQVYKRLTLVGEPLHQELLHFVPKTCVLADGSLDWSSLARIVFHDKSFREQLNNIAHPAVLKAIKTELENLEKAGVPLVILSAPLLFESNADKLCEATICVYVDKKTQLERLMSRDKIDSEFAQAKINSQMPLDEKRKLADYVIDNSDSINHTQIQFKAILAILRGK